MIIKVIWEDSAVYKEWYSIKEIEELINNDYPEIQSIGYLIKEDSKRIILAGNNDDEQSFSAITVIPKCCIKSKKTIIK